MRQRGLRQEGGIQRHTSGVRLSFSFLSHAGAPGKRCCLSDPCSVLCRADPLIAKQPFYTALRCKELQRQSAYRGLFRARLDGHALTAIRDAVNHGQPLGAEQFREQVEAPLGRRVRLCKQGRKAEPVVKKLPGQLGFNL